MEPDSTTYDDGSSKSECAVCLQPYVQPVQLPCRHIFCYLCVKGVTNQNKRCAMCRQEIPASYLDNPNLISSPSPSVTFDGSYQWFYEGRNGWWQYDDRTSSEIETAYQKGEKSCEVLIAGFLYVIDFDRSVQYRRNDPFRRRHVKRDLVSIAKKGVAGIRYTNSAAASCDASDNEEEEDDDDDEESGMVLNTSDDNPCDNKADLNLDYTPGSDDAKCDL